MEGYRYGIRIKLLGFQGWIPVITVPFKWLAIHLAKRMFYDGHSLLTGIQIEDSTNWKAIYEAKIKDQIG
jgi:hypothetical protein